MARWTRGIVAMVGMLSIVGLLMPVWFLYVLPMLYAGRDPEDLTLMRTTYRLIDWAEGT